MKEMKQLIEKLNQYSFEYYSLGQPSITDETYDSLYDKLLKLEKESGITLSNSPSQKVGNVVLNKLQKVKHEFPLLSLDKTKDINVLSKFTKGKDGVLMLKLDGLTIDNTYEDGILIRSETRGDGQSGEDITENAKTFTNLPLTIPYKGRIHIIGEAIITYDVFDEINAKLPQDKKFKNPRNLCSGSVRQLDSKVCKDRKVKFFGYIIEGTDITDKYQQLCFINSLGFDTTYYTLYVPKNSDLQDKIDSLRKLAQEKKIPIDGMVLCYKNMEHGKSLGMTTHHPLHSIAFKFGNDVEITTLKEVRYQVGRTGVVTPLAVFEPVELYGTTVEKATLHNISIMKSLKLGIGDNISVTKANEIIPMVVDNLDKSNTLEIINICPVCGEKLIIKKDNESEVLMCINDNCKAKLVQKISHYASRNALNIDGFSEATIEKFIELGYLKSIQDIYYLASDKCKYKNEIIKLDGFGKKSFENMVNAINKSKQCKLESFIFGLGIPNVGKSTAKNMVEFAKGLSSLDTINNMRSLSKHMWTQMKDCGEIGASSIYDWFRDIQNLEMLGYLTQMELNFTEDIAKEIINVQDNPLKNKHIYPTGKFTLTKSELKLQLEKVGAIIETGYKKSLDYLICGGDTSKSGKVTKAQTDGVKLMTEDEMNIIFEQFK